MTKMAETFRQRHPRNRTLGPPLVRGVVDDILDGGRAYEIAWADEDRNEVPAADVPPLAVNEEPRPKKLGTETAGRHKAAAKSASARRRS